MKTYLLAALAVTTLLFTSCKPYGTEYPHDVAQVFYDETTVDTELVASVIEGLEEYGWIDTIPKSILIGKKNDTLFVNLVTIDRLKNDIPTEKVIAAIGINLSRKLNQVVISNMADNYLKPIRSYPAIVKGTQPDTYADTSVSQTIIDEVLAAKQLDTILPDPNFIYIKKAGPAYHIHMTYDNYQELELIDFQNWANTTRKSLSEEKQLDVYLSEYTLRDSEVLYGRR